MLDKAFIQQIQSIILEAGKFVLQEYHRFDKTNIQHKNTFDLVSYVDIETEKFLVEKLALLMPEAGFIAEEQHTNSDKEWNWIIDPLDGTTNFTRQLPVFAISVALAHRQGIYTGFVFNIPANELFYAVKNQGAFLNDTPIKVAQNKTLSESLIATGFSVSIFEKVDIHLKVVKEIITHSLGVRRMGAAAVDLCYVACGRFDAFFEWYLNPWDVAAGSLIAQEAGAIVTDFSGLNNYLYGKEILAAQPFVHSDILLTIKNAGYELQT